MTDLQKITYYGKLLHEKDLVIGAGGNISMKSGDSLIIKRRGAVLSDASKKNFIKISLEDLKTYPGEDVTSESPFHVTCYEALPSVGAVIHTHSPYAIALANKFNVLQSPSYEFDCIIGASIPIIDFLTPGSPELASAIGNIIKQKVPAVILTRHGSVTVGEALEEAFIRALALERACKTILHS